LKKTMMDKNPGGRPPRKPTEKTREQVVALVSCGVRQDRVAAPRPVIAEVDWHPGELYPRVGLIFTNMAQLGENVVARYKKRGTLHDEPHGLKAGALSRHRADDLVSGLPNQTSEMSVCPSQFGSFSGRVRAIRKRSSCARSSSCPN
jgi:hypothetical protein